jgi:hypothetical protein
MQSGVGAAVARAAASIEKSASKTRKVNVAKPQCPLPKVFRMDDALPPLAMRLRKKAKNYPIYTFFIAQNWQARPNPLFL